MRDLIKQILREEFPNKKSITIISGNGHKHNIDTELAITPGEKVKGMMHRDELCDDCGMLFNIDNDNGFHMEDVSFPLDMIFIKDGIIIDIINAQPEQGHIDTPEGATHNLEVSGGYCRQNNITPGNQVIL